MGVFPSRRLKRFPIVLGCLRQETKVAARLSRVVRPSKKSSECTETKPFPSSSRKPPGQTIVQSRFVSIRCRSANALALC